MNDDKFEAYSALLDGEADVQQLVAKLADDPEGRARLARYSLIAEGLRGEPVRVDALSVADAVQARLKREPVILAPQPVVKQRRPIWWQPAAGIAIAASVALVAVGLMPRLLSDAPDAVSTPVQVVGVPTASPVLVSSSPGGRAPQNGPEQEDKLNRYLVDHNEFATQGWLPGIVPYATFVSYDTEK